MHSSGTAEAYRIDYGTIRKTKSEHKIVELTIGCLLQILNPNPDAMSKMITENASEEFLHSLSNYCALQVSHLYTFFMDLYGLYSPCLTYSLLKIVGRGIPHRLIKGLIVSLQVRNISLLV